LKTQKSHADLKTKISVKQASLEWLLNRVGMTGDFEGSLDVDITLNGQGESLASLMAGLDGTLANPQLGIDPIRTAKTVGAALLGPVGWGYLLVSVSSGDENPCLKAL
jgi:hypothetical protein